MKTLSGTELFDATVKENHREMWFPVIQNTALHHLRCSLISIYLIYRRSSVNSPQVDTSPVLLQQAVAEAAPRSGRGSAGAAECWLGGGSGAEAALDAAAAWDSCVMDTQVLLKVCIYGSRLSMVHTESDELHTQKAEKLIRYFMICTFHLFFRLRRMSCIMS